VYFGGAAPEAKKTRIEKIINLVDCILPALFVATTHH